MTYQNYYTPFQQPNYYQQPEPMPQYRQGYAGAQNPQMIPQNPQSMGVVSGSGSGIVWVPNLQAAQEYLVAPNSAVALWDSNRPTIYLKQSDSSGKPNLVIYDLVERTAATQDQDGPKIDPSKFVSRTEFAQLVSKVDGLSAYMAKEDMNNGESTV